MFSCSSFGLQICKHLYKRAVTRITSSSSCRWDLFLARSGDVVGGLDPLRR